MNGFWDRVIGGSVAGVFVLGVYVIAHFILKADDTTILVFVGAIIWGDITRYINRPDPAHPTRGE